MIKKDTIESGVYYYPNCYFVNKPALPSSVSANESKTGNCYGTPFLKD